MTNRVLGLTIVICGGLLAGCTNGFGPRAQYGITFYCPGAGNVDMGDAGLREGLRARGYRGEVSRLTWSVSFNPAIDQTVRAIAKLGATRLAGYIQDYMDQYPDREVNLVGLSAGSGVAIWALETLKPQYKVNNVILLGSSLSSDYDVSDALKRVKGNIYCYYSPNDAVLAGPMKVFGTIDGKLLVDGAGAVGLHPPHGQARVVNIGWRPEFERYGYTGGHVDSTSPAFVQQYISQHIMAPDMSSLTRTVSAAQISEATRLSRAARPRPGGN